MPKGKRIVKLPKGTKLKDVKVFNKLKALSKKKSKKKST